MAVMSLKTFLSLHHLDKTRLKGKRRIIIKPVRPSRESELWYKAELLKVVRYIRSIVERELLPILKHESFGGDALPMSVAHQLNLLSQKFGGIELTAKRLARLAVQKNLAATDKRLVENIQKAMGVNIQPILSNDGVREEVMKAAQANIELITSIPEKYFDKLRKGLEKNWEAGERWEDLSDFVEDVGDVTESRAKLIARDQTSKMNGAFNRARQTSIGITKYRWQTAGDERVRPTHRENDGRVFRWDNPPSETGNPGEDVNCRCVAIPEFDLDGDDE